MLKSYTPQVLSNVLTNMDGLCPVCSFFLREPKHLYIRFHPPKIRKWMVYPQLIRFCGKRTTSISSFIQRKLINRWSTSLILLLIPNPIYIKHTSTYTKQTHHLHRIHSPLTLNTMWFETFPQYPGFKPCSLSFTSAPGASGTRGSGLVRGGRRRPAVRAKSPQSPRRFLWQSHPS